MSVTISQQKLGSHYSSSVADLLDCLAKKINLFPSLITGKPKSKVFNKQQKMLPIRKHEFSGEDLEFNFLKIYRKTKAIFKSETLKK